MDVQQSLDNSLLNSSVFSSSIPQTCQSLVNRLTRCIFYCLVNDEFSRVHCYFKELQTQYGFQPTPNSSPFVSLIDEEFKAISYQGFYFLFEDFSFRHNL